MVLHITRARPALCQRSRVRRQRRPVPRDEPERGRARARETAGRGQDLTRMDEAISLHAQTVYPSLEGDDLDDEERGECDVNDQSDVGDGCV